MIIISDTYRAFSLLPHCASPLDCRQTLAAAQPVTGGAVRPDKHCGHGSQPQLQRVCAWSGLKVFLSKMLIAEERVGCGDPLRAGPLHLLLPFAKLIVVLGESKECHAVLCSFATPIGHTVVGHPVFLWGEDHPECNAGSTAQVFPSVRCSMCSVEDRD